MNHRLRKILQTTVLSLCAMAGCTQAPQKQTPKYTSLPNRDVPAYLEGTIYQYTDLTGTEPFPVSGFGLVTHLHGTGGSRVPTPVRSFMVKELARHFDNLATNYVSPEDILNSKDVAIVKIDGYLPPGARAGRDWNSWFDVQVSALPDSDCTSLAHGVLFLADLKVNGANPSDPGNGMVTVKAQAAGEVFVNPAYVLDSTDQSPAAQRSRRTGIVMSGGRVMQDQPLLLRLRSPQRQMARAIERRIIERFQDVVDDDLRPGTGTDAATDKKVADADDEGVIRVYVPKAYTGNWAHFAGIVTHLYLNGGDAVFAAKQAQVLADEAATDPKAPLLDISYCWEGLGQPARYAIEPLLSSDKPDVRFAAARAAAFLHDPSALPVLLSIAQSKGNPFRVSAVQVMADLPETPLVDRMCRSLLSCDEATVRLEAYKMLARHEDEDPSVYTRWITNGNHQVFALDIIHGDGPPMVWASRQGIPRVAVFGNQTSLDLPMMFEAMDRRLTISTDPNGKTVTIFYQGVDQPKPVRVVTSPDIPEIVAALAGDGTITGPSTMHLGYSDIVAILQSLIAERKVVEVADSRRLLASFMLEDQVPVAEPIDARPLLRNGSRPQSHGQQRDTTQPGDHLLRGTAVATPSGVTGTSSGSVR
jgi:flagellar basal body P-ring protein FlgI